MTDVLYDIAAGQLAPGNAVRCGNRLDWPKKQRRHTWQQLGPDMRNQAARGFVEGEVRACQVCGTDQFHHSKQATSEESTP